jgi:hypothetical protein
MKTFRLVLFCLIGAVWLGVLTTVVRSGITPSARDSKKRLDRAIRIVGGLVIGLLALFGLIMTLIHS